MNGSPHLHGLIWTSDCPKLTHETKQNYADFIDSQVQAYLPDTEADPELYDLVQLIKSIIIQKHVESTVTFHADFILANFSHEEQL